MYAKKNSGRKLFVAMLAIALLIGCTIGGTIAWLMDTTNTVTNTFTVGDVNIDLKETVNGTSQSAKTGAVTNNGFTIVPGKTEAKDPSITVEANSEDCFVFVKITESNITKDNVTYVNWNIADGWQKLDNVDGVYYREYTGDAAQTYAILKDNKVSYSGDLTKAQLDALGDTKPTLTFQAYAIQKANGDNTVFTAAAAWTELNPTT